MANKGLLGIDVEIKRSVYESLTSRISTREFRKLTDQIDSILFGRSASLATSVKNQGRLAKWKPLSHEYFELKQRELKGARQFKREQFKGLSKEAKKAKQASFLKKRQLTISTKIWVRTGKVLEFIQTRGDGRYKKVSIHPQNFFIGLPFYEVMVKNIPYWEFPHEGGKNVPARPMWVFTKEDEKKIGQIITNWLFRQIQNHLEGKAA